MKTSVTVSEYYPSLIFQHMNTGILRHPSNILHEHTQLMTCMYSQIMNIALVHWCTGGEADIHSTKVTILWPSLKKQTHDMHVTLRPFILQNILCKSMFFLLYS